MKCIFLLLIGASLLSCQSEKKEADYFTQIAANDIKLRSPKPGEWRYTHDEAFQSLADYQALNPVKADSAKSTIYLQSLGNFNPRQSQVLEATRKYLEIFFQMKVVFLNPLSDSMIPAASKRIHPSGGQTQLHSTYLLDSLLIGKIPAGGYAMMAITEKDLFPKPDWNFVFGIASYTHRVGASSVYRYQANDTDNPTDSLFLKRIMATAAHELGHMFSLRHCVVAKCTMNGSNSLAESDRQPLRLCAQCQSKLQWNIKYDNKKRLAEMMDFFRQHQLQKDLADLSKDSLSLQDK
jgi:archaemetzincin